MQYKYISDLHLFHSYSLDWRPQYKDCDAFAEDLIETWNTYVTDDDVIIVVGDVGFYCESTINVLKSLKGTKILVVGNHDASWAIPQKSEGIFAGIHEHIQLDNIFIEHIPDESHIHSSYYIHGHHHRYDTPGMLKALKSYYRDTYRLNCCTDLIGNKPVTLQELIVSKEVMLDELKGIYNLE